MFSTSTNPLLILPHIGYYTTTEGVLTQDQTTGQQIIDPTQIINTSYRTYLLSLHNKFESKNYIANDMYTTFQNNPFKHEFVHWYDNNLVLFDKTTSAAEIMNLAGQDIVKKAIAKNTQEQQIQALRQQVSTQEKDTASDADLDKMAAED